MGASIIYQYVNGALSSTKLWGDGGAFPCGATVAGINDFDGGSCGDVNLRIGIGTPGCPVP